MDQKSKALLVCLLLFISGWSYAQKDVDMDSGPSFKDRIYVGGGFGFSSGSVSTNLSLSPVVGYMLTRKLSVGVGLTYQYYKDKIFDADDHRYGGNVYVMQMLIYRVFVIGQYSVINLSRQPQIEGYPRETFTRFLIGGGLSQPIGRANLNIMAMYDVTYATSSPYASPWVIGMFISI